MGNGDHLYRTLGYREVQTTTATTTLRITFKIRLQTHRSKSKVKPRIDIDLLKDEETKKKFCESVRCKMEENRTETEDIEEVWEQKRSAYVSAAEGVLGLRKGRSKPWISDSTWKLID